MKQLYFILAILITAVSFAQTPQGFNYQATVRDNSGELVINQNVYFKFNVIQGSQTSVPIYTEIHYVSTDDLGQVGLVIGQGTSETGSFSQIDWSLGNYFLGIELDTGSGNDYVAMGTTQMLSVPYALYAESSGNATTVTPNLQTILAEDNSANNQQIKNLADPTDDQDAVTKAYTYSKAEVDDRTYTKTEVDNLIAELQSQIADANEQSLQDRLDNGETPCEIYQSDNSLIDELYGLTYQGGLIFYLNTSDCSGMIAAPTDQSDNEAKWGCYQTYISGATDSSIGSGLSNTNAILVSCNETGIASRICADLVLNGYDDWYLPSKDELNLMYTNLKTNGFGNFSNDWYWSSTDGETNGEAAWVQSFRDRHDGSQATYDVGMKDFENHVRAIRSF